VGVERRPHREKGGTAAGAPQASSPGRAARASRAIGPPWALANTHNCSPRWDRSPRTDSRTPSASSNACRLSSTVAAGQSPG